MGQKQRLYNSSELKSEYLVWSPLFFMLFLDKSQVSVKWIKKEKKPIPLKMVRSKDWAENVSKVKL